MLRVLVFLFLSFTFVLSSFAQSVKISGWVTNRQGEAVDMARWKKGTLTERYSAVASVIPKVIS